MNYELWVMKYELRNFFSITPGTNHNNFNFVTHIKPNYYARRN